jgi:hypothetical protein
MNIDTPKNWGGSLYSWAVYLRRTCLQHAWDVHKVVRLAFHAHMNTKTCANGYGKTEMFVFPQTSWCRKLPPLRWVYEHMIKYGRFMALLYWHYSKLRLHSFAGSLQVLGHQERKYLVIGWWFGSFFIFPYIGNNHPNWLIFFRGVETTNQYLFDGQYPKFYCLSLFLPTLDVKKTCKLCICQAICTFAKNTSEANLATKTHATILCCIFQVLHWSYLIWLNQNYINPYICSMFQLFTFFGTSSPFLEPLSTPQLCRAQLRHVAPCFAPGIGSQFCKGLGQVPRGSPRGPLGVQRRGSWALGRVGWGPGVLGWRGHISDPWGFHKWPWWMVKNLGSQLFSLRTSQNVEVSWGFLRFLAFISDTTVVEENIGRTWRQQQKLTTSTCPSRR